MKPLTWIIIAIVAVFVGMMAYLSYLEQEPSRKLDRDVKETLDSSDKLLKEMEDYNDKRRREISSTSGRYGNPWK